MIKIFVPSWRRPTTMTTPGLLAACGVRCTIIVRSTEASAYDEVKGIHKLMIVGRNDDLTKAREAARRTLKKNEWALHMDDNVRGFIMPKLKIYSKLEEVKGDLRDNTVVRWREEMNVKIDFRTFYDRVILETLEEAERRGVNLCGVSAHENPAFRPKKWADVGYVCGKTMLLRNVGMSWKQSRESSGEDYALTAAHLYRDGRVLINKWGHTLRTHYMAGGCGPYLERLPSMKRAQAELLERYGNLFAVKHGTAHEGELRVRFNSLKQVELWQKTFKRSPNYA